MAGLENIAISMLHCRKSAFRPNFKKQLGASVYRLAGRQPAARASASVQNQRSPLLAETRVRV